MSKARKECTVVRIEGKRPSQSIAVCHREDPAGARGKEQMSTSECARSGRTGSQSRCLSPVSGQHSAYRPGNFLGVRPSHLERDVTIASMVFGHDHVR